MSVFIRTASIATKSLRACAKPHVLQRRMAAEEVALVDRDHGEGALLIGPGSCQEVIIQNGGLAMLPGRIVRFSPMLMAFERPEHLVVVFGRYWIIIPPPGGNIGLHNGRLILPRIEEVLFVGGGNIFWGGTLQDSDITEIWRVPRGIDHQRWMILPPQLDGNMAVNRYLNVALVLQYQAVHLYAQLGITQDDTQLGIPQDDTGITQDEQEQAQLAVAKEEQEQAQLAVAKEEQEEAQHILVLLHGEVIVER